VLSLTLALLAACGGEAPKDSPPASVIETPAPEATPEAPIARFSYHTCPFGPPEGQVDGTTIACGTLEVPERRDVPDSRKIDLEVAVLRATERNRFRARRRFREIERAHHAARGLDGQDDLERAGRQSRGTLLRADRLIDRAQGVNRFGLRQEDAGNARCLADRVDVFLKIWRVRRVRANPDGFPVQRRRVGREALARGRLLRGRHRVLEIDDEAVGVERRRFLEEFLAVARQE
jgi:hypothetical protein